MSEPEFYIGIDFGHEETKVSCVSGTNRESISRILLRKSGDFIYEIYRYDKYEWKFVRSMEYLKCKELREGFKGMIHNLPEYKREALREFAKLVFNAILDNDEDLRYDPETGMANFVICIANPSDWRRQSFKNPKECLTFFQEGADFKPAKMCINESDAAFYTIFEEYTPSDTVFVIDLGSSSIDFSTYQNTICNHECCWAENLGAHIIEDKIVEYGYTEAENKEENIKGMLLVEREKKT